MKCPLIEVTYEVDLDALNVAAPAIAYVRETGDFFFRHEAAYWGGDGREPGRWVRAPFSGGRALIRATTIGVVAQEASAKLYRIVGMDPEKFNPADFPNMGGGYWDVIKTALRRMHNDWFLELNTKECQDEDTGPLLYDIQEGDIVVEVGNDPRFVQETTNLESTIRQDNYDLHKLATRPIKLGTPGIHLQYAREAENYFDMHPERIGCVVMAATAEKGATSLQVCIYPAPLPKGEYGSKQDWIVDNSFDPDLDYRPGPDVTAPATAPWAHRKMAIIQAPYATVDIPVQFSGLVGGAVPAGLGTTLHFDAPLPFPIYTLGSAVEPGSTLYVPARTSSFGWMPIGAHGGGMGQTSLDVQVTEQGRELIDTGSEIGIPAGATKIPLYKPWIGPFGGRRHSNLRGIKPGDFVSFAGNATMHEVIAVEQNSLEEPHEITISPPRQDPIPGHTQTADGVWVSDITIFRYDGFDRGGLVATLPGWVFPDGQTSVPLLVKGSGNGVVRLWAPIAQEIPKGTRMNIYVTPDLDTATFAYHDQNEFLYQLDYYNNVTYRITRQKLVDALLEIGELVDSLEEARKAAIDKAAEYWFSPPYRVNKDINEFLNTSKYGQYGSTFAEVRQTLASRAGAIRAALQQGFPSVGTIEYINLINYGVRAIS